MLLRKVDIYTRMGTPTLEEVIVGLASLFIYRRSKTYSTVPKPEQQITLYPHRDDNNLWRLVNASESESVAQEPSAPLQPVVNGMKIRLEHKTTEKRLHSHDVRPPVSEVDFQNEVSGYGFPGSVSLRLWFVHLLRSRLGLSVEQLFWRCQ